MKRILRHYLINLLALYLINQISSGMVFEKGIETFLLTAAALAAGSLLAKPVINILLLPLNLITFGLFRWVSSAVVLYLVTLVVPGFKILMFNFAGFYTKWIDIPQVNLKGVFAFVLFAFLLSIISSFVHWVRK